MPLFYFSSARPRVQQMVIKNMLKEKGEPALHRSVSQQLVAHLSASHLTSSAALHSDSLLQELTTAVVSSFLAQTLMHLSIPAIQVDCLLLSASSLSFAQVSSVPVHT